jgi:hypothetical protein
MAWTFSMYFGPTYFSLEVGGRRMIGSDTSTVISISRAFSGMVQIITELETA